MAKTAGKTGVESAIEAERSLPLTRRLALGTSLLAAILLIAPVIVVWLGGIDLSGCSFEEGCRTASNLVAIWIDSTILCAAVAAILWIVHIANSAQYRRRRE